MEESRIAKFVSEHVDASLPADRQTLILSSDMDLMGGDNIGCTNDGGSDTCKAHNDHCKNFTQTCSASNLSCLSTTNVTASKCEK